MLSAVILSVMVKDGQDGKSMQETDKIQFDIDSISIRYDSIQS
jgi:hypothetical protein